MLLKGVSEVQSAGRPLAAAEMVLVRIAYAADLPTPDEAIRALDNGGASSPSPSPSPRPQGNGGGAALGSAPLASAAPAVQPAVVSQEAPAMVIGSFTELVALAADRRDIQTKLALERDVRLVRCEDGKLEIALEQTAAKTLINDLSRKLQQWTGRPWMVVVSREPGAPTLKAVADNRKVELEVGVRADPLVKAVLERFPGAEIVGVRGQDAASELPPAEANPSPDDLGPEEQGFGDNWERED
jgi:DNA polymerase-3 subunit gamma/tau